MDFRVQQAVALIHKDFRSDYKVDEIANRFNLSSSRLRHLFKEETGATLVQYRKTFRLRKAKHLLETTFLSVKQIMLKVGYKDESNFARDFKKRYGLTPARYRENYLKGNGQSRAATFTNR